MKLVRSMNGALPQNGCVLTIGNFDAVHIGHQAILARLKAEGERLGLPVVVMSFDPHPEEFFVGKERSARLSDCSARYFLLKEHGVDWLLLLPFNKALASTSAEDFIREYLIQNLGVKYLLIGDDFQFGRGRIGDFELLKKLSSEGDYVVENTPTVEREEKRVSSTRVREVLLAGNMRAAEQLLGRRYNMVGRVVRGQQLGRQWGFPTLNIPVRHKPAVKGIFAVEVKGLDKKPLAGVASLGTRPTIDHSNTMQTILEVHLFNLSREVYGERVCVEFVQKIRDELKFDSINDLKKEIANDAEIAKGILNV